MLPTNDQQKEILAQARKNLGNRIAYSPSEFFAEIGRLQNEIAASSAAQDGVCPICDEPSCPNRSDDWQQCPECQYARP